jgi:hypothetical protein
MSEEALGEHGIIKAKEESMSDLVDRLWAVWHSGWDEDFLTDDEWEATITRLQAVDALFAAAEHIEKQWLHHEGEPYDVVPLIRAIQDYRKAIGGSNV